MTMRRDKFEIVSRILKICKQPSSCKTRIVYGSNLNFKTASQYLDWMKSNGLVAQDGRYFKVLPKGDELLSNLRQKESILGSLKAM
jgi:predicted transcriptional regulator